MKVTSVEYGVFEGGSWELQRVGDGYRVSIKGEDMGGVTEVCVWFDDLYDAVIELFNLLVTFGYVPEDLLKCISKYLKD